MKPYVSVICDQNKLSGRGCEGAPDFVAEVVSPPSPGMDYVSKPSLYQEAGVREYWICGPRERRVLACVFDSESAMQDYAFSASAPFAVFPGFEFDFGQVGAGM